MFNPPAPRMSFINSLSDFTVITSFQPSSTATQRFCSYQIASLTETPHLLFHTSMRLDRSRPLNTAVLTDQARDLAGAVTFTKSTPGCRTLAGPSLKSAGFRSLKPKGYADSPGLKRPGALQKPGRPGRVLLTRYDKHIPGIYLSDVPTQ
jgi:hypothetical protein